MKIVDYKLVNEFMIRDFEEKVMELLEQGYVPFGHPYGGGNHGGSNQVMVKYEETDQTKVEQ